MPVDPWIRAFLAMTGLFLVSSSFTLAKVIRDMQDDKYIASRLDQARVDKLTEHDLLASPTAPRELLMAALSPAAADPARLDQALALLTATPIYIHAVLLENSEHPYDGWDWSGLGGLFLTLLSPVWLVPALTLAIVTSSCPEDADRSRLAWTAAGFSFLVGIVGLTAALGRIRPVIGTYSEQARLELIAATATAVPRGCAALTSERAPTISTGGPCPGSRGSPDPAAAPGREHGSVGGLVGGGVLVPRGCLPLQQGLPRRSGPASRRRHVLRWAQHRLPHRPLAVLVRPGARGRGGRHRRPGHRPSQPPRIVLRRWTLWLALLAVTILGIFMRPHLGTYWRPAPLVLVAALTVCCIPRVAQIAARNRQSARPRSIA